MTALALKEMPSPALAPSDDVIDLNHLSRMTLGERSLEREVLELFGRQAEILLPRIAAGSQTFAAAAAHTLKGSALGIGAWRVARAAEAVELAGVASMQAAVEALSGTIEEARCVIAGLLVRFWVNSASSVRSPEPIHRGHPAVRPGFRRFERLPSMVKITFIDSSDNAKTIDAEPGATVMESAIKNDILGIEAECGGACACATCHVYVDEAWREKTGGASPMEEDMLDFGYDVRPNSRLSCQIKVTQELDGLVLRVPERQA